MEDSSSTRKITDSRPLLIILITHSSSSHLSPVLLISLTSNCSSHDELQNNTNRRWWWMMIQCRVSIWGCKVDYKKFIQWSSLLWPHPSETGSNSPVTRTLINTFIYIFIYLQVSCNLQLQASWLGAMWMRNQLVRPGFLGTGYWEIGSYAAGKREG
jgi:hypothetical protein